MASTTASAAGNHGFPRALTSFVGRADEVDSLTRLLARHQLVTVTGPGGVGKTRLAAEVTRRISERSGDQIWLVELAAVRDPRQVPALVAAALGGQQRVGRSITQAVAEVLAGEQSLLVLDNCEQVVDAVADFCAALLSRTDDVRVLATSREPIGVAGEARLRLRPLPAQGPAPPAPAAPAPAAPAPAAPAPAAPAPAEAAGVVLFADRVRLIDPDFELTPESAALARQIVARLDGLPLAIELAAARCESLGLSQLLRLLAEPLGVLTQGARTAPPRQRSLRATVDWSYQLMSDQQRRVFRRVAIFPGSFTLPAAAAVAGRAAGPAVLHLVDCSLLAPPADAPDGSARYLMLGSLRAFALEQLARSGEQEGAAAALCAYAVTAAQAAAHGMHVPGGEPAAARWFDTEDALLHQALSWALENDPARAPELAVALSAWWQLRGRALTGYPLLHRALRGHSGRDRAWFAASTWLGRLAHSTAQWHPALAHFDAVCDGLASSPPSTELVDGLAGRSGTLRNLSRLPEATDAAQSALGLAQQLRYAEGEALALTQLSLAAGYSGDTRTAMQRALQAAHVDETRLPDRMSRRVALVLTIAQADSGELDAARQTCAQGLASARTAGDVAGQADFLYFTTHITLRAGAFDDAGTHIRESLRLTAVSGDRLRVLDCLDDCAQLCAATGRWVEAVTLWAARSAQGAALEMPELPQDVRSRTEPLRKASHRLGQHRASEAERRGAMMNLETAAELASMLAGPDPHRAHDTPGAAPLTPRERELVTLVARGRTDAEIAAELFISIRTVRSHLDRIRDKSGSRRRADLTRLALRAGLV